MVPLLAIGMAPVAKRTEIVVIERLCLFAAIANTANVVTIRVGSIRALTAALARPRHLLPQLLILLWSFLVYYPPQLSVN